VFLPIFPMHGRPFCLRRVPLSWQEHLHGPHLPPQPPTWRNHQPFYGNTSTTPLKVFFVSSCYTQMLSYVWGLCTPEEFSCTAFPFVRPLRLCPPSVQRVPDRPDVSPCNAKNTPAAKGGECSAPVKPTTSLSFVRLHPRNAKNF